jgi:hypothetical protein
VIAVGIAVLEAVPSSAARGESPTSALDLSSASSRFASSVLVTAELSLDLVLDRHGERGVRVLAW